MKKSLRRICAGIFALTMIFSQGLNGYNIPSGEVGAAEVKIGEDAKFDSNGIEIASISMVENVEVSGGLNSMNVSWMPKLEAMQEINDGKDVAFYAYLDEEELPFGDAIRNPYTTRSGTRIELEQVAGTFAGVDVIDQYEAGVKVLSVKAGSSIDIGNVEMPAEGAFEMTIRYASTDEAYLNVLCDKGEWGRALTLPVTSEDENIYYKEQTLLLDEKVTGTHNISLEFLQNGSEVSIDWIEFSRPVFHVNLTGVPEGIHEVSVDTAIDTKLSQKVIANAQVNVTDAPAILTSESISIIGYQIRTNNPEAEVGFRTACSAPKAGQIVETTDGAKYTVKEVGTIYALDDNVSGSDRYNLLDTNYTILNGEYVQGASETHDYSLPAYYGEAVQNYGGGRTVGYIASAEKGILEEKADVVTYANTITGVETEKIDIKQNTLWVRAFVVTEEGPIIYSTNAESVSILEAANYLYTKSMASNYVGHEYLYDKILRKYDFKYNNNSYFVDKFHKVNYGWNDNLYDPD